MSREPALEIPDRLEAITPGWLARAVGAEPGAPPRVAFDRIGEGVGLMGELARFELRWPAPQRRPQAPPQPGRPDRVIVKLPGADPGNRASGQILGLYEREARFYLELAERLPVRTPRCYHAAFEPDPNAPADLGELERNLARLPIWLTRVLLRLAEWMARRAPLAAVLVLEDLGALRAGDQLHGGDERDLGLAIDALARLHASAWQRESWLGLDWIARMKPNVRLSHAFFSRNYRRMPRSWRDRLGVDGRRVGDWLVRHGVALNEALLTSPDTLCHSDYRLDNLYFDDARDEVIVLDWQLPSRGPGVLDLAYFLSGLLDDRASAAAEEAWVRRYHDGLLAGGVAGYDWPRCVADYRLAALASWQRCIASASAVEPGDARGMAMLESWWDRMRGRLAGVDPDAVFAARG